MLRSDGYDDTCVCTYKVVCDSVCVAGHEGVGITEPSHLDDGNPHPTETNMCP